MCFYKCGCVVVTMAEDKVRKLRMSNCVLSNRLTAIRVYLADVHPCIVVIKHPNLDVIPDDVFVHMNVRNLRLRDTRKIEVCIQFRNRPIHSSISTIYRLVTGSKDGCSKDGWHCSGC